MQARKKPSGPSAPAAPTPAVIEAQQFQPPAYVSVAAITSLFQCVSLLSP